MARILVVDDSPEMRHLLTSILVEEGHKVVVAPDGQKALDMVVADPPDIMVLDIMMPAMDGYMVLKELRATGIRDTTKILILTAKTSEHDWVRGYKLGADQYLTKPFDIQELTVAVETLLLSTREQLKARREEELNKAQLLSRLESLFES